MPEELTPEEQEFRGFCVDQVQRLSQFKEFQFMSSAAHKDYRKWLERRGATEERVRQIMDIAVELEAMPTIAVLNSIHTDLFGQPFLEPEISLEERAARAIYLRDWYAQELAEAERRRVATKERKDPKLPAGISKICADDIEALKAEQARNRKATA